MRFIHSSGATLFFKAVAMSCGLGVSLLIARVLGPEGRGIYGLVMTLIVLTTTWGLFGFGGANAYLISKDRSRARRMGSLSVTVASLGSLLAIVVIWAISVKWPGALGELRGALFLAVLSLLPVFLCGTLFSYAYLGRGDIVLFNLFETGQRAIFLVSAIIVLAVLGLDMVTYVAGIAILLYALVLAYVIHYFASAPHGSHRDLTLLRQALSFGPRSYVATVVTYGVMRSGIFFVAYYRGTTAAGFFSVAQQLSELLVILPAVVATVLSARIARGDSENLTPKVLRTVLVMLLPLATILALTRKVLIGSLFGVDFLPVSDAFLIFLPGTFLLGLETILAADMAGHGYPWPAALAWIPVLVMNVAGYVILIPRYGINGAAAATATSFLAITAFMVFYYKRISGQRWSAMFLVRRDDLRVLLSMVSRSRDRDVIRGKAIRNANQPLHHKSESEVQKVTS